MAVAVGSDDDTTPAGPSTSVNASAAPSSRQSTSSAPTSSSKAAGTSLSGLLLTPDEINSRMKTTMTVSNNESGSAPLANLTVTPSNCASAYAPATTTAYDGSGFTGIAVQGFRGPGNTVATSVIQAAAKFPDAAAAQAFLDQQFTAWGGCKFTQVTADYGDGTTAHRKFTAPGKSPGKDGDTLVLTGLESSAPGAPSCDRAMTIKSDVVVDVVVCKDGSDGQNAGGYGTGLAHAIQRNIS
ncbi:sensor domain-containing protein [Mycobacterium talmoniae]|uniref:PknH-like extracellular domain-containing protein n=1 Tax=Mycobacterium talmoniae TaxID=1858794 RepID=A0A1S1NLY3_9MYCO|nr:MULTISPECIES: sensor domain-containing protein [Mycobacterium]OHV04964.1 hypothetical protein BKN37_07515 [Mycobacterium talmoniae]PQM48770.1 hypothetical protein C1Y40_01006 [Mycobacterium talmoniae]